MYTEQERELVGGGGRKIQEKRKAPKQFVSFCNIYYTVYECNDKHSLFTFYITKTIRRTS